MSTIESIINIVREMNADADTIENEIDHFFSSLEFKPKIIPSSNDQFDAIFYGLAQTKNVSPLEKWIIPNKELSEYHRHLITHYEKWYNQGLCLIRQYNKSTENEFVELHNGRRESYTGPDPFLSSKIPVTKMVTAVYGISELLQFNYDTKISYDPSSLIKGITTLFSKQRVFNSRITRYCKVFDHF